MTWLTVLILTLALLSAVYGVIAYMLAQLQKRGEAR